VHRPSGRRLGYGALAKDAAKLPVPPRETLRLKDPARFRYLGKGTLKLVDGPEIVSGKAQYGIDVRLDGMLYAVVARPPVYGGKVSKYDASQALKVPGVVRVVEIESSPPPADFNPLGGVAVIARNTWAAIKGREALTIEWNHGPNARYDSAAFRATLEQAARGPGKVVRNEGDVDAAMVSAARRLQAEYYIPHLAHAAMEPPAAAARIVNGKCEVWGCVQSPQAARDRIAKRLGLRVEDVTVNVTLLGGGFGRKSKPDFMIEAAVLSKAMGGAPVKATWTRDDDLRNSYYHTVSVEHLEAALDAQGKPSAWLHRTVAPTIRSTFAADAGNQSPSELGMTAINMPFVIPNVRIENPEATAHTRIGWFRSVSNIPHAFAVQSFVAAGSRLPSVLAVPSVGAPTLWALRRPHGGTDVPTPEGSARLRIQLVPVWLRRNEGLGCLRAWPGLPPATAGGGRAGAFPSRDDPADGLDAHPAGQHARRSRLPGAEPRHRAREGRDPAAGACGG
jgi:isoquinoline 1-oxidoreductase beta subunit